MLFIFDLDQTLVDTKIALRYRDQRNWSAVYNAIPRMSVYPMIQDSLEYLKGNGHKIAVVTSSPSKYALKVINHFRLGITNVVGYHDTQRRKPNPAPILRAIKNANGSPQNSISFGDRDIDIRASRIAGVKSCGCFWDCDKPEYLKASNPDVTLIKSSDLYSFLIENY